MRRIGRRGTVRHQRYGFVVPTVSKSQAGEIEPSLSLLCPRSEVQLDPRTPKEIVRYFSDSEELGHTRDFITFDESDALARATGGKNQWFGAIGDREAEFSEPFIANACLDVIETGIAAGKWDDDKEDEFIKEILLPNLEGGVTPVHLLCASAPVPPEVPGLQLPPVLHPDIVDHRIFKRRKWRRPKFTMSEFLASGCLQTADENTRRAFWGWLQQNRQHVGQRERPKLADLAIWPDVNGELCPIPDLCEPKSPSIGNALGNSIRRPDRHVIRSKLASVGGRAKTSIRQVPNQVEVTNWIEKKTIQFARGEELGADGAEAYDRFERDLMVLLRDKRILGILQEAGVWLWAVAQDGTVQLRTELVAAGQGIERADLADRFLLKDGRHSEALDKVSPARRAPSAVMVLEALSQRPENTSALQARLKLLLDATDPGDAHRKRLAELQIIPANGSLRTPSELAFRGKYWGDWKIQIPIGDLSQDDRSRYLEAGVTPAVPDQTTSRAFFEWLAAQKASVLRDHVVCVLRHFAHKAGPTQWARNFPELPAVPVRNRDGIRLVSLNRAIRGPVYLNDAGAIGEDILQKDGRVFLAIHQASGVREPITERLRELLVRSLRTHLTEPEAVIGQGNVEDAGGAIVENVKRFQSPAFQETFLKRLDELDVENDSVRHNWHIRVRQINRITLADNVEARYRFRRKPYSVDADAGFDPEKKILWVKRTSRLAGDRELYRAIASQLVFKPTVPRVYLGALQDALEVEFTDRSYGRTAKETSDLSEDEHESEKLAQSEDGADPEGDGVLGHSPFVPDPVNNLPTPGPIPRDPADAPQRGGRRSRAPKSTEKTSGSDRTTKLEEKQIEDLKLNQYASHCQVCLCERPPHELAPDGSYVAAAEVRRRIMEAHHVDVKSALGARHAGNLILLCRFHHENLGRRLTRRAIAEALRGRPYRRGITFRTGSDVRIDRKIDGWQIVLQLSDTDESVKLFFTDDHADYWLSTWREPD